MTSTGWSFAPKQALRELTLADERLGGLIRAVGPFALEPVPLTHPFDALAQAISHQQLTAKAANTIMGRVRGLYPKSKHLDPAAILNTPDTVLRTAGLSGGKTAALKDLAAKTLDGTVPAAKALYKMPNAEIIERLTAVRGIGQWTVEMMLMFRLGRPDILPVDDYGIRKGFARVYRKRELPKPKDLARFGEKWQPYRTVASWYLWRALELPPETFER